MNVENDVEKTIARMQYRLNVTIALLQEARDVLPTICLSSARLHNVRLSIGDRIADREVLTDEQIDKIIGEL